MFEGNGFNRNLLDIGVEKMIISKKITCLTIILISLFFVFSANGQTFQGEIDFTMGFPQNEFDENLEKNGFGLGGTFGYSVPNSPVILGADLSFMNYGKDERTEHFSLTIPDVDVDVETTNNIVMGHLMLRIQPLKNAAISPYLDGLFGFNYLYTETTVKDEDAEEDEEIASSKNLEDTVMSYGVGGGFMVRLWQGTTAEGSPLQVMLNLRTKFIWGEEAKYLKEGSIIVEDYEVYYDVSQSKTDMLIAQIGVSVNF
jgi:hypothetical protein